MVNNSNMVDSVSTRVNSGQLGSARCTLVRFTPVMFRVHIWFKLDLFRVSRLSRV
ncbi:hypothetical protein Hanom_Chr07g00631741 [Helianthus anomalus]